MAENYDAWLIFTILLTQSVDGFNGILKYDPVLLGSLFDLLEVGSQTVKLSGKLLVAIDVANTKRLAKKKDDADSSPHKKRTEVPDNS